MSAKHEEVLSLSFGRSGLRVRYFKPIRYEDVNERVKSEVTVVSVVKWNFLQR